jgi:hypothetical protein
LKGVQRLEFYNDEVSWTGRRLLRKSFGRRWK